MVDLVMKKNLLYIIILILFSNCKTQPELILNIDPKYHGWIYLVPAIVPINEKCEIKQKSFGIVYISDSLYNKIQEIKIKISGTLVSPKQIKTYNISFYPKNSYLKILYKKFYFPFRNVNWPNKEDTIYTFKKDKYNTYYMDEFEYYYTTGIIDSNIVRKW